MKRPDFLKRLGFLLAAAVGSFCLSCADLTQVENDIKELQTQVTNLTEAVEALEAAHSAGKIIRFVEPIVVNGSDGWKITFTDDSVIRLMATSNKTFISTIDQDTKTGVVTLVLTDGRTFKFNMYVVQPTGIVLLSDRVYVGEGSVGTFEFRVNPSNAVLDLDLDDKNPQLAIDLINPNATKTDAASYITQPTRYELVSVQQVKNEDGETKVGQYKASIKDLGVDSNYCESIALVISCKDAGGNAVQLSSEPIKVEWRQASAGLLSFDIKGAVSSRMNGNIISVRVDRKTDLKSLTAIFSGFGGKVMVGDRVQESGKTVNDFSSPVTYKVVSDQGEEVSYVVAVSVSGLPTVHIETKDHTDITSKEVWLEGTTIVISNADEEYEMLYENANVRGRGNSTWGYPKKPYAIKLDKKAKVLGMPKHKRWVLLANWMDKTLMRNAVAFEIARCTHDLEWTPRGTFVEVVLNGKMQGNYYLCEQIKLDENRVDIAEMEPGDVEGDAITGGYLLEMDTYFDEVNKFRTNNGKDSGGNTGMPVNIKEPDEDVLQTAQFNYIKKYVCDAEDMLFTASFPVGSTYKDYIDINSFVDWWLVHELTQNAEPKHPKSSYMHKDRGGKLKAGPVWDFDWHTFTPDRTTIWACKYGIWYERLFMDPAFIQLAKEKWGATKSKFEQVAYYIDETAAQIKESAEANGEQWPISSTTNGDEKMSFDDAVVRLKTAYTQRIKWMDDAIDRL